MRTMMFKTRIKTRKTLRIKIRRNETKKNEANRELAKETARKGEDDMMKGMMVKIDDRAQL